MPRKRFFKSSHEFVLTQNPVFVAIDIAIEIGQLVVRERFDELNLMDQI